MSKKVKISKSIAYAFSGIKEALTDEPNFKIHVLIGVLVSILAFYLNFSRQDWLILIFTIFFVLILELINTAIEEIVNLVSPEISQSAKIVKDVSAAAVLLGSILAVIVGAFLFIPKLLSLL
ncbi:MAG: diacylglycerol kinase family protein [Patescibacteria group bacterium]